MVCLSEGDKNQLIIDYTNALNFKSIKVLYKNHKGGVNIPKDLEFDWRVRPITDKIRYQLVPEVQNYESTIVPFYPSGQLEDSSSSLSSVLIEWRDQVAKFDDESPEHVLPIGLINYISVEYKNI